MRFGLRPPTLKPSEESQSRLQTILLSNILQDLRISVLFLLLLPTKRILPSQTERSPAQVILFCANSKPAGGDQSSI